MARKRTESLTGSLFDGTTLAPVEREQPVVSFEAPAEPLANEDVKERPRLRLIVSPEVPEEDVVVEANGHGQFVVAVLSHRGTTSREVVYTRKQLEMMVSRAQAALEVSK